MLERLKFNFREYCYREESAEQILLYHVSTGSLMLIEGVAKRTFEILLTEECQCDMSLTYKNYFISQHIFIGE